MAIGKATFQSAGQISQHIIPGAYSRINSVTGLGGLVSANRGVIMGKSTGGQPATLLQFGNAAEAAATLRSGELYDAVRLSFNPGDDLSPQYLFAMRVNTALQAKVTLVDGSAHDMVDIESRDWGLWANQIKVKMEAGATGKKVTITFQDQVETLDNLYRSSLEITHATDTVTITNNSGTNTLLLVTAAVTIQLADYPTIGALAARVDQESGFTAAATPGQENASSLLLDSVSGLSLTGGYTCQSTMQAVIDGINTGSAYAKATDVSAANDRVIPENYTETYMTGGSEGSYTSTEWTAALLALEAEDVQFVSTPDGDSAVHSSVKSHCESMSAVTGKKERQFLVGRDFSGGANKATEIADVITDGPTLNSKYGMLVFNGGTQYDVDGAITQYGSGYVACMLMAMKTASAINQPLTYNTLNLLSLEFKLSTTEIESMLEKGVAVNALNPDGLPYHVRQLNTYQTDDLKWNEFSMVQEMLYVSRDLRTSLDAAFVGRPGTQVAVGAISALVNGKLREYQNLGLFQSDGTKAFWGLSISILGDKVYVDYDAYITAPVNFIFVTSHFHEMVVLS